MMNEKKARKILTDARADATLVDALLEVFSLVGHDHDASDIITGKDETLDETLEELGAELEEEDDPDEEEEREG